MGFLASCNVRARASARPALGRMERLKNYHREIHHIIDFRWYRMPTNVFYFVFVGVQYLSNPYFINSFSLKVSRSLFSKKIDETWVAQCFSNFLEAQIKSVYCGLIMPYIELSKLFIMTYQKLAGPEAEYISNGILNQTPVCPRHLGGWKITEPQKYYIDWSNIK